MLFLTVPPDFQYQNEKQVTANQDYFFKKFFHFGTENGEEQLKKTPRIKMFENAHYWTSSLKSQGQN